MASPTAAAQGQGRRPSATSRHTAPSSVALNGHFATGASASSEQYEHGVQVIDQDKNFNPNLPVYFKLENITPAGFNYHLVSVFGSQSTGKSTLLNHLFGTEFDIMAEDDRRQTTKGIWLSKNKRENAQGGGKQMAENILVMDVEGTDGRERGEDQDFERKSALFAIATSEVLIVNIWEHQVGLYQGANMGLLKTVFEVNLQLFLKDRTSVPRSLLFFVIRDHLGHTPLANLRKTLLQDMDRLWDSISKPPGLEKSKISDYFDFAFVALPHKILQPVNFEKSVAKLGRRFKEGYKDHKRSAISMDDETGVFLPEYHRRIPADGFSMYASSVWDQIESNKDLDLPTQQELLAQYRCDEIARDVLVPFDEAIAPFEEKQAANARTGKVVILPDLGIAMRAARQKILTDFKTEASRYHKGVYERKREELEEKIDGRLKTLFLGQLNAVHKSGVTSFSDAVSDAVRQGQKKGANYDFAEIVETEKAKAFAKFQTEAQAASVDGAPWSDYKQEFELYRNALAEVSARLRKDEMRRLATRVERWVRTRLGERVGLEFNSLGAGSGGSAETEDAEKSASEDDLWDRVWAAFIETVKHAEGRFSERARGFDASPEEVEVGIWRLRRKSWGALRAKLEEELMEGNILLKLREHFEDKFRYDAEGVPRIWKPSDDIESIYTAARTSTLTLIPFLSHFRLSSTSSPPPLDTFIGAAPPSATAADEEDLPPIGGVDAHAGDDDSGESATTLEAETTVLSDAKQADLAARFRKAADGVYVEAKRSALGLGSVAQVPLYFYGLLLALGWNELVAVLKNPLYFLLVALLGAVGYITWSLGLWGPMLRVADAAVRQSVVVGKEKLRDFLEVQEGAAAAVRGDASGSGSASASGARAVAGRAGEGNGDVRRKARRMESSGSVGSI